MVFCDPQGEQVATLRSRAPDAVRAQIEEVVAAHTKPALLEAPVAEAKQQAAAQGKLLAVVFVDADPRFAPKNTALLEVILSEGMAELREQLVWAKRPIRDAEGGKTQESRDYRASRSPTVIVIDPALAEPEDGVLKRLTSFKRLRQELEKLLKKRL